ncbi:hypothetical protein [Brevibacillus migulae]|uniref:hypothetical protein n=1 Tax=Brevibacillus migulae TaxID=1644114 RepID=UPI00106EC40F|nr:hypothetical protein [Brevibacillus migulae]
MFHPTVFDNIKVVLEGAVYDCDFEGAISITNRADMMDMATFQRLFQIEFTLAGAKEKAVIAQMQLRTTLSDIASEQLEQSLVERIGCTVCIHFQLAIHDIMTDAEKITAALNNIWGHRPHITQYIGTRLDEHRLTWPPERFENKVTLDFHRKIDEGNIEDMRGLVEHSIESLRVLEELNRT